MFNRSQTTRACLVIVLCCASFEGQEIQPDLKERVDAALPRKAPATPRGPRRLLVINLSMRDGTPVRGNSEHLLAGIQYALGDLVADDAPDGTRGVERPGMAAGRSNV